MIEKETFNDIKRIFRISLVPGEGVSDEAIRQFARVVTNIAEDKEVYRVVSPGGAISFHATVSDISRFLYGKGIIAAQIPNIHMAIRSNSSAYGHTITKMKIERNFK